MLVKQESTKSVDRAKEWCQQDPNPTTAAYVQKLIDEDNDLEVYFPSDGRRIGFGTAGLRSRMMPGPLGMNDLVVTQTAQGLAKYCQRQTNPQEESSLIIRAVVGYDHRANSSLQLSSLSFALLTSMVFAKAGIECYLFDGFVPTPLVPFAVTKWNAAIGIMITASHNPKDDAGYKVYSSDGCQIRAPQDKEIAKEIMDNLVPWVNYGELLAKRKRQHVDDECLGLSKPEFTKEMTDAYFRQIRNSGLVTGQARLLSCSSWTPPLIAYSAMHGVGAKFVCRVCETFGLPPVQVVPSQRDPDPAFPTVCFPNPEEKGAMDLPQAFANENHCQIVVANDPDADRLAVAERDRDTGKWTLFTGDQIGVMLGHWLWEQIGKNCGKPVAMCASTASSKMLAEIARVEGFHFEDTLTGFKWIGSRAACLNREGYKTLFAYEEAIGFCCGDVIFDKDGVSALGVLIELAYAVYHKGMTLSQHMQSLYAKYGEFVSNNGYFIIPENSNHASDSVVHKIMDAIRCNGCYKQNVGPYAVESVRDLGFPGYDSTTPDNRPTLPTSKSAPMLTLRFTNGCVFQLRASGTEPKLKYYIELRGKPGVARQVVADQLREMSAVLLEELIEPEKHGLKLPSPL